MARDYIKTTMFLSDQPEHSVCPISGLPVYAPAKWQRVSMGNGYSVSFHLIGGQILFSKGHGDVCLHSLQNALNLRKKIIQEQFPDNQKYVVIEDASELGKFTREARLYYKMDVESDSRLLGLVFFGGSLFLHFSISLAKRIHLIHSVIQLEENYANALKVVLSILQQNNLYASLHQQFLDQSPPPPIRVGRLSNERLLLSLTTVPNPERLQSMSEHLQKQFANSPKNREALHAIVLDIHLVSISPNRFKQLCR